MISVRSIHEKTGYEAVHEGLDFILRHFQGRTEAPFPRKIMTQTLGYQKEVYSRKEAMEYFSKSNYVDCRIRAYPDQSHLAKYLNQNERAPSLIMMDIDGLNFPSDKALEAALRKVKTNLAEEIGGIPTVLWSGNGYHVIQPIDAVVLENISDFNRYEKPSEQFLRFAESYLSEGKADREHCKTLAFGNCLLRIPGSHNSKLVIKNNNTMNGSTQVKVIQEWDGNRPNIKLLLGSFHAHLIDQRIKDLRKRDQLKYSTNGRPRERNMCSNTTNRILWIERLLQTPIADNRRYCVWRIMVPYLVNARQLSDEESYFIIISWLEKCNLIKRLSFYPRYVLKYNIRNARKNRYFPISWNNLKRENVRLYETVTHQENI